MQATENAVTIRVIYLSLVLVIRFFGDEGPAWAEAFEAKRSA
jgi:hypothetical protein